MSKSTGVLELPQRLPLTAQTAASLRKAISGDLWQDFLPSERRLCDLLGVSRPTVRSALRTLADEGVVTISPGRRIRVCAHPRPATTPARRLVALVAHQSLAHLTLTAYRGISEMRAHLSRHGFSATELVCAGRNAATQRRRLQEFVRQHRVFCCVLLSVNRTVQEWFSSRNIPALVLGTSHASAHLPCLDVDYRAVCRHAAGVLLRAGHRRMAFLVPDLGVAGDLASEEGFRAGVSATAGRTGAAAQVIRHSGAADDLRARLSTLLRSPRPPTALLVARPVHTVTVLTQLLRLGIRVPDMISLVARDHDPVYAATVSHYAFPNDALARRLSRLMLQLVSRGSLPPVPHLIFPRYVNAGTVRDARPA